MKRHHYELYGLRINSEIGLALPESERVPPDVVISNGPRLGDPPLSSTIESEGPAVTMSIAGVGCYRIWAGKRIEVSTAASTDPAERSLFLLGSAFGVLLQQRGILALHANATSDGKRAVAVAGVSGAGKSTFAAQLLDAGMTLLSDDVCAIKMAGEHAFALPGISRMRLWADASERLGWSSAGAARVSPRIDKFEFKASKAVVGAVPLAGIYVLERVEAESDAGFHRLVGADAMAALMLNSYRGDLLGLSGGQVAHFQRCIEVAKTVPVFKWRRPWGTHHAAANLARFLEQIHALD